MDKTVQVAAEDKAACAFAGNSVREALSIGARALSTNAPATSEPGARDAGVDARRLLQMALDIDALALLKEPERRLDAAESARFQGMLDRRRTGEPVSRIAGQREFYGRTFQISSATLDPRPESETLIDAALQLARVRWPCGEGLDILDIGVGSGCLLVTLLAELPMARGMGIDISAPALRLAEHNAEVHGVAGRASFVNGRTFAAIDKRFDLIVSNPPYIPTADIEKLERDVRQFDPRCALDGGADGLDIYREIAAGLRAHARPGWALLEVGAGQAVDIAALMRSASGRQFVSHRVFADMAGQPRVVAIELQR